LNQGIVPVVPPLGFDGDGKTYRVNSDSVAVAAAEALKVHNAHRLEMRGDSMRKKRGPEPSS
jgi:acetylglutamate kinase